ncbi:hypothetical protein AB0O87_10755 [Microbacterium sp. NPDC076768]|uniref:hypothetical protein n=1 Tax=Microbacterium sp. NPDC076768 TaxID=3154858 RepID=UPI003437AD5E
MTAKTNGAEAINDHQYDGLGRRIHLGFTAKRGEQVVRHPDDAPGGRRLGR